MKPKDPIDVLIEEKANQGKVKFDLALFRIDYPPLYQLLRDLLSDASEKPNQPRKTT